MLANGAHIIDGKPEKDDPASESNPERPNHTSPLAACTSGWNEELICLLLEKGADLHFKNSDGKTIQESATAAKRGVVLDALARLDKQRREEAMAVEE